MTPAEANQRAANFVTDVPVQGPTDEGLRAADCWQAQNVLPTKRPACVDCEGPIPMWAQRSLSNVRGQGAGIGEQISFGGASVRGFGISAAGDPEVWTKISTEQQTWVMNTLVKLNEMIVKATGTSCPTFGPSITAAGGCFQAWFNANMRSVTGADGKPVVLRTDGVFDQQTLDALRTTAALHAADFPAPFPGTEAPGYAKSKLSTGAMVGIAAAGATVVGLGIYAATRKKKK